MNIESLIPEAVQWVAQEEQRILSQGLRLDEDQQIDAYQIGIDKITKVRVMKVDRIPEPDQVALKLAMEAAGMLLNGTIGITFGHGIYIRSDHWGKRSLLVHELTHVLQYERLGGIENFLRLYISECLQLGYINSPLEIEAREMEKKICG